MGVGVAVAVGAGVALPGEEVSSGVRRDLDEGVADRAGDGVADAVLVGGAPGGPPVTARPRVTPPPARSSAATPISIRSGNPLRRTGTAPPAGTAGRCGAPGAPLSVAMKSLTISSIGG